MISMLLKSLGVKASANDVQRLEALIPQIPGKAVELVNFVNASMNNFDARLRAIEDRQNYIIMLMEQSNGPYRNDGGTVSRTVDTNGNTGH